MKCLDNESVTECFVWKPNFPVWNKWVWLSSSQKKSFTINTDQEFSPGAIEENSTSCDVSIKFVSFVARLSLPNRFSSSSIFESWLIVQDVWSLTFVSTLIDQPWFVLKSTESLLSETKKSKLVELWSVPGL